MRVVDVYPTSTRADTRGPDRQQRDGAQWTLGDLAASVETTYGEGSLQKYAEEVGVEYSTLKRYRRVAASVETGRRRPDLSWSHDAEVAALDAPEPWLQMAAQGQWSVASSVVTPPPSANNSAHSFVASCETYVFVRSTRAPPAGATIWTDHPIQRPEHANAMCSC